jgi:beta-lactamase regulating signal transducer with metallopeptidase domain
VIPRLRDLPGAALTDVWMAFDPVWSPQWVWLRYATALRATAVLLVLALAALVLRRAPASVRAGLWACALLAVLPLPLVRHLPAAAPLAWRAHVVPEPLATPMVAVGATMVAQSWPGAVRVPWTSVVGVVWAVGAGLVLARLACGWAALAGLSRRARSLDDPAWRDALAGARAALGMRRRVRLRSAAGVGTPLTWGTLRPTVLVPADAVEGAAAWPAEHRRAVLLHELAHVRRLDCLLAALAHGTCAAWWFHPGVWWAAHRLRRERERACDERVLLAGVRPSDYAECLVRIADRARPVRPLGPAVVAAGFVAAGRVARSHLAERLRAILAPDAEGAGGAARRRRLAASPAPRRRAPGSRWSPRRGRCASPRTRPCSGRRSARRVGRRARRRPKASRASATRAPWPGCTRCCGPSATRASRRWPASARRCATRPSATARRSAGSRRWRPHPRRARRRADRASRPFHRALAHVVASRAQSDVRACPGASLDVPRTWHPGRRWRPPAPPPPGTRRASTDVAPESYRCVSPARSSPGSSVR